MRNPVLAVAFVSVLASLLPASAAQDPDSRMITVSAQDGATASRHITLALDKAAVVQLDTDARDVLVSNPDIVDAVVRTPRRIFLLARKTGQTNAFFFDGKGRQILNIDIRVERDVADLQRMIHADMPDSDIKVAAMNDNVVLTGNVDNAADATRAQDLAASFAGDPKKVVNMLKVQANEQVMLSVRIAEMQRNVAKQFGINLASAQIVGGVPIALQTSNPYGLLGQALSDLSGGQVGQVCPLPSTNPNPLSVIDGDVGGTCTIGNNIQGTLKALEQVGLVHILAEPNLTAVSGETAKFLAGGEFPVPSGRDAQGNVSVQFQQFGVGLSFTPVVLSENRISLQISTEVSELTNTGAFNLAPTTITGSNGVTTSTQGLTIPALAVRRAQTTVELPSGGSFAIAGLLQHTSKQTLDAFPGLKDLPVLGALFRSRDFQDDTSELVVMVSAYLVNPVAAGKLALPTDGFQPSSDLDTILMGQLNNTHGPGKKSTAPPAASNASGFIVQ